jgi:prefoldin subunit 5
MKEIKMDYVEYEEMIAVIQELRKTIEDFKRAENGKVVVVEYDSGRRYIYDQRIMEITIPESFVAQKGSEQYLKLLADASSDITGYQKEIYLLERENEKLRRGKKDVNSPKEKKRKSIWKW